ncbi:actin family protein [Xylona heveae TC161]|uniref:Actin family protein n=1 Tax=Xylona heveae (strain CBS 132557 / TC161) TaxID=1328760 RepID=A0A165GZE9_XYLHT|nr:actin family protein [Xylona heveae TC161]KZF22792.1 actin family protein [Xylona heveae TC161]
MPRQPASAGRALPERTLVVDNGGYTIKAGYATTETPDASKECHVIPNCMTRSRDKKIWIGAQLDKCRDFGEMAFRRPVEKGYPVNWEAEKEIWDHSLFDKKGAIKCDPHDTNLILTEAPNALPILQTNCDQIIFEEYEFASYYRCIGPSLNAYNDTRSLFEDPPQQDTTPIAPAECLLVVDSGFSHTTITPLYRGQPINTAIRRLEIGGKFLTNYLKELVSVRHYNMMDETHLMNEVKEAVSFVSSNFSRDLEGTWKGNRNRKPSRPRRRSHQDNDSRDDSTKNNNDDRDGKNDDDIVIDYVLPDYNIDSKGYMRPHDSLHAAKLRKLGAGAAGGKSEDFMTLGNERFVVPELLFSPGDVGMKQAGIPGAVMQCLSVLPEALWPAMLANIMVVGGNANIRGFVERLEHDIRALAPSKYPTRVVKSADPIKSTWTGGARLATNRDALKHLVVTRQEYQEHGSGWLAKKFGLGAGQFST